ncbi:MAG: pentapeptide repeat-containing protein [Cystobacter sp.]
MDRFGNVLLKNKDIDHERVDLTEKEAHYFLGPNLTMKHCTLVLKVSARRLFLDGARFTHCTFEVKQELKNHQQWVFASLTGCQFKGRLSGGDFGHWPEYSGSTTIGSIENCDFTEARLAGCRFHGCDINTLRFPKWPCFTFLDPIGRARELRGVKWPGSFGDIVVDNLHTHPPSTKALTYYAPSAAERFETTPEELRAVLEKFDCIAY